MNKFIVIFFTALSIWGWLAITLPTGEVEANCSVAAATAGTCQIAKGGR